MKATGLNHVSVHADDMEESARFYVENFGLEEVPAPSFGYPVRWFRLGDRQLHLFQRQTGPPQYHHFAIDVDDYEAVYRKLKDKISNGPRRLPDGSVQMYVHDPAGNLIEIDWPDASTLDPELFGDLDSVPGPPEATLYMGR